MFSSQDLIHWNGKCFNFILICVMLYMLEESRTISAEEKIKWGHICPVNCTCNFSDFKHKLFTSQLKIVNCSGTGYSNFPKNISMDAEVLILSNNNMKSLNIPKQFKHLKYLDASNNRISMIDDLHKLSRLKGLDLHNNRLMYLQNGQFSGMKYLSVLDLSNNKLHLVEDHAFGGLNDLQKLYLNENKLNSLEKQWFVGMPSLRMLNLSRNYIRKLEQNIFEAMGSLIELRFLRNKIQTIEENAFHGLNELLILDLSANHISIIPHENLKYLQNLKYLHLDDNPIYNIHTGSFSSLNISMLSLSYMPKLAVVEKQAFVNLSNLIILQIHDNDNLVYIDPEAFDNVPFLKYLYLHNNQLMAMSEKIQKSLPSLKNCHIYDNPLRCDCNALWIKKELIKEEKTNYSSMMFDNSFLKCDSPVEKSQILLKELPLFMIHSKCAAKTIPLFNDSYNISVGEELRLQCHGIGIPEPIIEWILPNGSTIEGSFKQDRYEIINNCTLVVRHLRVSDSGIYRCKTANLVGADVKSTSVTIRNKPIRIFPSGISDNFVTVAWNGSSYWSMISDYQIRCRDMYKTSQNYQIIHLRPFSKRYSYTFKNLQPQTMYEFCIIYVYETENYKVDCINVTTQHQMRYFSSGITHINSKLVASICTVTFMIIAICCSVVVMRKFSKRKYYEDPSNDEKKEFMSQIPLDNLNNPPSTPLCSSRTALINSES